MAKSVALQPVTWRDSGSIPAEDKIFSNKFYSLEQYIACRI